MNVDDVDFVEERDEEERKIDNDDKNSKENFIKFKNKFREKIVG